MFFGIGRAGFWNETRYEHRWMLWRFLLLGLSLLTAVQAAVAQLAFPATTFAGQTAVGSTSQTVTVTVTAQASGTVTGFGTLTGGVSNQTLAEFNVLESSNCAVGSAVNAGQTCQLSVAFAPRFPGVRQGAALLLGTRGAVLGRVLVSGIGQGSLPVLNPGEITTVAGDGQFAYQRDGVLATVAPIFLPTGLVVDAAGDLFFCDSSNNRVRQVDAETKMISTVAGTGSPGFSGDGNPATSAALNSPSGLAMDGAGNLYISDTGNSVVRRVDAITGFITTVAGTPSVAGYGGDGLTARDAMLSSPVGLAFTPGGDLLIADSGNNRVRLLTLSTSVIQTIAGTGDAGAAGDGLEATQAQLNVPFGIAARWDGAIAIADKANQKVRLVDQTGVISTVAGTGDRSYSGDGGPPTEAKLDNPAAVAFDPAGDLFIADSENNRVRAVFGNSIVTVVGNGNTSSSNQNVGDGGPADQANLYGPYALVFDAAGNLWVADLLHNLVREVYGSLLSHTYPAMKVGNTSAAFAGSLYNAGNANLILQMPVKGSGLLEAALDSTVTTCNATPMQPREFCNMGIEFSPTVVSPDDKGSVTWVSNAPNVTPVDALDGQVLSVEPTAVALSASANPGVLGHSVTLTGSVTLTSNGKGAGLTGTVTFSEGSTPLCQPASLDANGNASCTVPSLALGSHTFTATYSGDANDAAATSAPYVEMIKQQPALALAVSSSPAVVTSNVTLTLVATDTAGSGVPTGTVNFYDGTVLLATVPLNSAGQAQWSTGSFSLGTHALSAQYSGDGANVKGTSNTVQEAITPASTVTVLASSSSDPMIGSPLSLVATVVSNLGLAPTGVVQFTDGSGPGAAVIGSATLDAKGTATITVSTLVPGAHSVVATYEGDVNDAPSSSSALVETVKASGITVGSSSNPAVSGQNITLTAQLNASGPVPATGTAIFRDNGVALGSATFNAAGTATLATSTLAVGTHGITVSYAGDNNYAAAGGQISQVVIGATTSITLTASANPATYGQPLVFTAAVASNGGVATGPVTFTADGTAIGSAPLNASGIATVSLSTLSPGDNTVLATYAGDGKASPSASAPLTVVVKQATSVIVSASSNPAYTLSSVSFTATVLNAGGAAATGSVTFTDGSAVVGVVALDGSGRATLTLPQLSAGTHNIVAAYAGDVADLPSASAAFGEKVQPLPTTTTLTGSATDPQNPQQMTLIAVVKGMGITPPSGAVTFTSGKITLGQATVDGTGVATITVIFQQDQLSQPIVASYAGDVSYAASQSAITTITAGAPAQFTLALSAPSITLVTHQHTSLQVSLGSVKGFTDTISLGCLGLPFAGTCTFTPSQVTLSPDGTATATLILDTGDPLGAGTGTTASTTYGRGALFCCLPIGLLNCLLRRSQSKGLRRQLGALLVLAITLAMTAGISGCSGLSTSGTPPGTYTFQVVGTGQGSGTTQAQTVNLVVTQ